MRLWTRQVPEVWQEIEENGVYFVREAYVVEKNDTIADFYLSLYQWYTKAARNYISIPEEYLYPIWLSVSEEKMLQPVENTVILEVEIPDGHFVLCNFDNWGYRVNYWYIPTSAEDEKKHRAELEKFGIASENSLMLSDKGNFYPLLKRKIAQSWDRVFEILPGSDPEIVATAWEIRKEWVKEVRFYE